MLISGILVAMDEDGDQCLDPFSTYRDQEGCQWN